MNHEEDTDISEDEVFFGKLTLKEIKKRLQVKNSLQDIKKKTKKGSYERIDCHDDLQIIMSNTKQTMLNDGGLENITTEHARSPADPNFNVPSPGLRSFLDIESIVCTHNNLDNTLDTVNFILNYSQSYVTERQIHDAEEGKNECIENTEYSISGITACMGNKFTMLDANEVVPKKLYSNQVANMPCNSPFTTLVINGQVENHTSSPTGNNEVESTDLLASKEHIFKEHDEVKLISADLCNVNLPQRDNNEMLYKKLHDIQDAKMTSNSSLTTPAKFDQIKHSTSSTASHLNIEPAFNISKLNQNKGHNLYKTPRTKKYADVLSPVACYINGQQTALFKVCDGHINQKKLLNCSSIPKPIKNITVKNNKNKENEIKPSQANEKATKRTVKNAGERITQRDLPRQMVIAIKHKKK